MAKNQADAMPVVEAGRPPQDPRRRRRAGRARPARRHHRGDPAALPAAADRLAPAGPDVRRVAAGPGLVLRPAGDALRRLLLRDGVHPRACTRTSPTSRCTCSPASWWSTTSARPGAVAPDRSGRTRALVKKMRMPREIFPVASMVVAAYHTLPAVLVLVLCCLHRRAGTSPGPPSAAGVLGRAILVTFAIALALFFSALNVFYRDFQNIVHDDHAVHALPGADDVPLLAGLGGARHPPDALPDLRGQPGHPGGAAAAAALLVPADRGHQSEPRPAVPARHVGARADHAGRCASSCCGWPRGSSPASRASSRSVSDDRLDPGGARDQGVHDAVPPHAQADGGRLGSPAAAAGEVPGGQRRVLHRRAGRVRRPDGPQRLGQEHPAQADQRRDAPRRGHASARAAGSPG